MLAALVPLVVGLHLPVGGAAFIVAVTIAGVLVYASFPLLIVSAQDLAPRASAAAAGMVMGLSTGIAGGLYIAVGELQDLVGLTTAMTSTFVLLVPAAAVAYMILGTRTRTGRRLDAPPHPVSAKDLIARPSHQRPAQAEPADDETLSVRRPEDWPPGLLRRSQV
jgi:hypothetical protein